MTIDSKSIERGRILSKEHAFFIEQAKYSEQTASYSLLIAPQKLLSLSDMDCIYAFISDSLQSNAVSLNYSFSKAIADYVNHISKDGDCRRLLEIWAQNALEIAPIIMTSRLQLVEHNETSATFSMNISPEFLRVLQSQYVSEFQSFAYSKWNWQLRIVLNADAKANAKSGRNNIVTRDSGRAPDSYRKDNAMAQPTKRSTPSRTAGAVDPLGIVVGKEIGRPKILRMADIDEVTGSATVLGSILELEVTETRDKLRTIIKLNLTDKTNTITVKLFPDQTISARAVKLLSEIKKAEDWLLVRGNYRYDNYTRDYVLFANDVNRKTAVKRTDESPEGEKRVELHLHTQMSAMDGLTRVSEVIATAARWGHKAIAITDHGVVHALPEAAKAAKKNGIKVIFGCEGYLLDDSYLKKIEGEYAAIALTAIESGTRSLIYEIAVIRFTSNGDETGHYHTYVNPGIAPSVFVMESCGFSAQHISQAPLLKDALKVVADYVQGAMLVIANGKPLYSIEALCDYISSYDYVDVSQLDKNMHLDIKNYSMESSAVVSATKDATITLPANSSVMQLMKRFLLLINELKDRDLDCIPIWKHGYANSKKQSLYHIVLLASNQEGLKNLYKLVSYSHLEFFHKRPRMPRSLLYLHRKGLILGSACERGELFRSITGKAAQDEQERIASWYDYLEIQPIANNAFMLRNGMAANEDELIAFNKRILQIGDKLGLPVIATGDVHFLEPEDAIYRSILMHAHGFTDAEQQAPLYFRTTDDMLKEFAYLGNERAHEVVVTNPNALADRCIQLHPFLNEKGTYSPELPGATDELERMTMGKAYSVYGNPLPDIVQKRLDKELKSIIGNGYSSLYMVAQKLVSKSLSDGYLVGSRGSVGSSFVATMLGITEVNALPPHYICPNCKYNDFVLDAKSRCGIDLPDKSCPVCGSRLIKEGYDIPFEVFLGFKGDKTPDIDLNFSGEYQSVAHRFTEEMFGAGHAFRAGTISAVQDRTVYGYVKNFCEETNMHITEAETNRLVSGCLGVKKTTGQHPGGIVIVPDEYEVFDFCPVQHPADKADSGNITLHFDFHALDDKLVKLDILGHDDPTALRMLHDLTGVDPRSIPADDPETMAIYRTDEPLKISLEPLGCDVGSLGIPEFGTGFVRNMLKETRPTTMEELVRIAGLSHGTDVWTNNAQLLVQDGVATLMDVICTRDDIMNYLISMGGEPSLSFKTMENVRKGRGLTEEMEAAMKGLGVPSWFIDSCKKIQYMFPRAHAAAYVMMSFRVAYYKVHYPLEFYAVYFTVRADTFDIQLCMGGFEAVMANLNRIKKLDRPDQKEKDAMIILEVVAEMNMRGFELLPVDIYKSRAKQFVIENGKLRPPFNSVAGLGENVAIAIANASAEGEYLSKEDFAKRTKANTAIIEKLNLLGCFEGLTEANQIRLF